MPGMKNIVIAGGTGGIGRYLTRYLTKAGHDVKIISRSTKASNPKESLAKMASTRHSAHLDTAYISWEHITDKGLPVGTDVVINLTGLSIGSMRLWTEGYKSEIETSRWEPTTRLSAAIENMETPPQLFISSSAVGIYGLDPNKAYTEEDTPFTKETGSYFTNLCHKWEQCSVLPPQIKTRVINPRFGVVLAHDLAPADRLLVVPGSVLGAGDQPFPWVHIDDILGMFALFLEKDDLSGAVNCVAPQITDNTQLTDALVAARGGFQLPALPAFIVRLMYGTERADHLLLDSPRVVPHKLTNAGFQFTRPTIRDAAEEMVRSR